MDRVRTRQQLQAEFPDNTQRLITAQYGRDLVVSSFGFAVSGSPGPAQDAFNSSGIGAWFDTGSRWVDVFTGRHWFCTSGALFHAQWQAMMYDGQPAGGDLDGFYPNPTLRSPASPVINVRLTGAGLLTELKLSGMAGETTAGAFGIHNMDPADTARLTPGMYYEANFNIPAGVIIEVHPNAITTSGQATFSGAVIVEATPVGYGWVEQSFDATTGTPFDKPGGRHGEIHTAPAIDANVVGGGEGMQAQIRYRGISSGLPVWSFDRVNIENVDGSGIFAEEIRPNLWRLMAYLVPKSAIDPDDMWPVDAIPNLPASIITSGTFDEALIPGLPGSVITSGTIDIAFLPAYPVGGLTGPGTIDPALLPAPTGGATLVLYKVNYNDFISAASNTIVLDSLPAYKAPGRVALQRINAWTGSFGPPSSIQLGYANGDGPIPSQQSTYANQGNLNLTDPVPTATGSVYPSCQSITDGFDLTCTLTGSTYSTYTGGDTYFWVEFLDLEPP